MDEVTRECQATKKWRRSDIRRCVWARVCGETHAQRKIPTENQIRRLIGHNPRKSNQPDPYV